MSYRIYIAYIHNGVMLSSRPYKRSRYSLPSKLPCSTVKMIALTSEDGKHQLYKQQLAEPDTSAKTVVLPLGDYKLSCGHGENVLLLVPSANKDKRQLLQASLQETVGDSKLTVQPYNIETGVEEPYNDAGVECIARRICGTVSHAKTIEHTLKDQHIGTIIIGAIENYIRTSKENESAVDFGLVVFYNVGTGALVQATTQGVPVQMRYLREALSGRLSEQSSAGSVTYGSILEKYFDTLAQELHGPAFEISKDWHKVVCGRSRYYLLMDTCRDLLETSQII
jgi:hypothetical protein